MESIRCHFFNGVDQNGKKPIWVQWNKVMASKEKGGLGVLSLYALNRTLLFKWVWRFHTKNRRYGQRLLNVPMVMMRGEADCKSLYPRIYALESFNCITVAEKMSHENLGISFRRNPRSGEFSVASVRKMIDDHRLPNVSTKTRWTNVVPLKINILAWKVKLDCLPTRFNISRRGMEIDSILCPSCGVAVESGSHVFFTCHIAREVFRKIANWWDVNFMELSSYEEWLE
ncbi:RNA-directed DNA polymerase, eukaryota, reverse transcriptase zinc-binding domain protein [Tanacetum coccineum]